MVFSFFCVFWASVPNQVEHTWSKSQFYIYYYEWSRILSIDKGLDLKLQDYGPCKISWKNPETSHLDRNSHIEGGIMQNHKQKKKWKKVKYGQNKKNS